MFFNFDFFNIQVDINTHYVCPGKGDYYQGKEFLNPFNIHQMCIFDIESAINR